MAVFGHVEARVAKAGRDLTDFQYRFVRASAANRVDVASNAGARVTDIVGVLLNKPNSGENATVAYHGLTKIVAGGALTANQLVTTNASGKATHAGSGDQVAGMVLQAAGAADELVELLLSMPAFTSQGSLGT